jgi:protein transport protein SEC20
MLTSKQLITALEKADWLDRIIIFSAFMFFVLVILFILKQRFIDRGLRIALWWTRFILRPQQRDVMKVVEEGSAAISAAITSSLSSSPSILDVPSSSDMQTTSSTGTAILESPTVEIDNRVEL